MACLGCEKPYREVVALLTESYLKKIAAIVSRESKNFVPEATTELLQVDITIYIYLVSSILFLDLLYLFFLALNYLDCSICTMLMSSMSYLPLATHFGSYINSV